MADHSVTMENTLSTLLQEKKYTTIRDVLVTMNPADIAAVFSGVEREKLPLLFRLLPKELAAESFVEMESDEQEALIRGISDSELRQVMDELYVDDAVDIVEEMPANVVQRILAQSDPEMRKEINEILQYPENSAGSVMTTEYVKLSPGHDGGGRDPADPPHRRGQGNHLHLLCAGEPDPGGHGFGEEPAAGAQRPADH